MGFHTGRVSIWFAAINTQCLRCHWVDSLSWHSPQLFITPAAPPTAVLSPLYRHFPDLVHSSASSVTVQSRGIVITRIGRLPMDSVRPQFLSTVLIKSLHMRMMVDMSPVPPSSVRDRYLHKYYSYDSCSQWPYADSGISITRLRGIPHDGILIFCLLTNQGATPEVV